jgi:hypothetical protein
MNRALFAIGVGIVGLSMAMMGCATGVDDPVPPAPAPEAQRDPPKQTLSGELRDPQQELLSGIAVNNGLENVPARQVPPGPTPIPEVPAQH